MPGVQEAITPMDHSRSRTQGARLRLLDSDSPFSARGCCKHILAILPPSYSRPQLSGPVGCKTSGGWDRRAEPRA